MHIGLGEVDKRKVFSVRVSDNLMIGSPILAVGTYDIVDIKYHEPCGEGDKHFVDVSFQNGTTTRFFDILSIQFEEEPKA